MQMEEGPKDDIKLSLELGRLYNQLIQRNDGLPGLVARKTDELQDERSNSDLMKDYDLDDLGRLEAEIKAIGLYLGSHDVKMVDDVQVLPFTVGPRPSHCRACGKKL